MDYEFELALKLATLATPLVVFAFFYFKKRKQPWLTVVTVYLLMMIGVSLFGVGELIYQNYPQPWEWDFLSFWLNGRVGISGENFYNVSNYQALSLPYEPSEEFRTEIIDVGFWYPPFTMFLFLPLALFDLGGAYLFWQALNFLLLLGCVYELWRLFLREYGWLGFLAIAVLMLRLKPTELTFYYAQTNFFAMLFFLLFWRNRMKSQGGAWLALSVVVKPYLAFLYFYPLITKRWKTLIVGILSLGALLFFSIVAFGLDTFKSYLSNPTPQVPGWIYTELTNQSLLATILRLTHQTGDRLSLLNPWYLGISLLLVLVTAMVVFRQERDNNNDGWAALSMLFLALIIYPANQVFYSVFLIMPVVLLLKRVDRDKRGGVIIFFMASFIYLLSGFRSGAYMFYANIFAWFICIVFALHPVFLKKLGLLSEEAVH